MSSKMTFSDGLQRTQNGFERYPESVFKSYECWNCRIFLTSSDFSKISRNEPFKLRVASSGLVSRSILKAFIKKRL